MLKKKLMVLLAAVLAMMLTSSVPAVAQQNGSAPAKSTVFVLTQTVGDYRVA